MELTKENFEKTLQEENVVLVDFWAPWCSPCRILEPIINGISKEYPNKVGKVNVDEEHELAMRYQIKSIPTMIIFKNGEIIPFRVAKINRAKAVTVDGNYFKKSNVSDIEGTDTVCDLYLKDYENNLLNTFNISGKIDSRSLNVDVNGLLQSTLSINQRVAPLRSTL
jgi:thioredoxin 1